MVRRQRREVATTGQNAAAMARMVVKKTGSSDVVSIARSPVARKPPQQTSNPGIDTTIEGKGIIGR